MTYICCCSLHTATTDSVELNLLPSIYVTVLLPTSPRQPTTTTCKSRSSRPENVNGDAGFLDPLLSRKLSHLMNRQGGVPFVFLERLKDDFMQRYGLIVEVPETIIHLQLMVMTIYLTMGLVLYIILTGSLANRPKMKEHMDYCLNHPDEMSKLSKLKAQITKVKGIMMDNIEKVTVSSTCLQSCTSTYKCIYACTTHVVLIQACSWHLLY